MRAMGFRYSPFLTFNNILKSESVKNKRNFKMVFRPSEEELAELLHEVDEDGSGEIEFGELGVLSKCQKCF